MAESADTGSTDVTYFGLSKQTLLLEGARMSYAIGIGTVVTTLAVFGVYVLDVVPTEATAFAGFSIGLGLLPAGLYVYDRVHERDLVIASLGHAITRPAALLYRILRGP
jgi:hypothetical protein